MAQAAPLRFYCIGDEDTVRGFRLAGVGGQVVTQAQQAATALDDVVGQPQVGIIIITETVAAWVREQVRAIQLDRGIPLVVEIPGPGGPLPQRESLRRLVQEAVGIHVGQEGED